MSDEMQKAVGLFIGNCIVTLLLAWYAMYLDVTPWSYWMTVFFVLAARGAITTAGRDWRGSAW